MLHQAEFVPLRKPYKRLRYDNSQLILIHKNVHPDELEAEEEAELEHEQYVKRMKRKVVCNVCCNNCKGDPIECSRCKYSACRSCYKQYLLSKVIAQCMHCQQQWNEVFLRTVFSPYWVDTEYKRHQKLNLFKLEQTYIHETSARYLRAYKRMVTAQKDYYSTYNKRQLQQHRNHYVEDKRRLCKILKKRLPHTVYGNFEQLISTNNLSSLSEDITKHLNNDELQLVQMHLDNILLHTRKIEHFESLKGKYKREQTKYQALISEQRSNTISSTVKKCAKIRCVDEQCRGIIVLGSKPCCSVCNTSICKECREPIQAFGQHECDVEVLKTIKIIDETTKCCPSCLTRISRIEGCDHMFCSNCKTSFDWVTGDGISEMVQSNQMYGEWQNRIRIEAEHKSNISENGNSINDNSSSDTTVTVEQLEAQFLRSVMCYDPGQFLADRLKFSRLFFFNSSKRCAETHYQSVQKIVQQCHLYLSKHTQFDYNFYTNIHHRLRYMNKEIGEDAFMQYISISFKKLQYEMEVMMLVDTLRRCLLDWLSNLDVYVEQQFSSENITRKFITFVSDSNFQAHMNNIFYERNKIYNPVHFNETLTSSSWLFDQLCFTIDVHDWDEFLVPIKLIEEFNACSKELSYKFLYLQHVCVTYHLDSDSQYWMLYELGNLGSDRQARNVSVDTLQSHFHPFSTDVDLVSNIEHIKRYFLKN